MLLNLKLLKWVVGFKEEKKINLKEKFFLTRTNIAQNLKWGQSLIKRKIIGIYFSEITDMKEFDLLIIIGLGEGGGKCNSVEVNRNVFFI